MKKQLKINIECSSITSNYKWLIWLGINGFSSKKVEKNKKFIKKIYKMVEEYNKE